MRKLNLQFVKIFLMKALLMLELFLEMMKTIPSNNFTIQSIQFGTFFN